MNFSLCEEEREIRDHASGLAERFFAEDARRWQQADDVPRENIRRLAESGLLALTAPVDIGGAARPYTEAALAIEAVSQVCPVTANYLHLATTGPAVFLTSLGTQEQLQRFLVPVIGGESIISISITEPNAGSAATDLATRARVVGNEVIVDGSKMFCGGADAADLFVVFVRFAPGTDGIGALVVERDTPGFTVGPTESFMSGQHYAPLYFDSARIPAANVLATEKAFSRLMAAYSIERCGAAAKCLGIAQLALNRAVAYVKDRQQFGRELAQFQGIQWMIAEMAMRLDHARLVTYRAFHGIDSGQYSPRDASIAKVVASEAAVFVTDRAMQLYGGYGISRGDNLEWLYRTARGYMVAGGTSEIHRNMIGAAVLGQRYSQRPEPRPNPDA